MKSSMLPFFIRLLPILLLTTNYFLWMSCGRLCDPALTHHQDLIGCVMRCFDMCQLRSFFYFCPFLISFGLRALFHPLGKVVLWFRSSSLARMPHRLHLTVQFLLLLTSVSCSKEWLMRECNGFSSITRPNKDGSVAFVGTALQLIISPGCLMTSFMLWLGGAMFLGSS